MREGRPDKCSAACACCDAHASLLACVGGPAVCPQLAVLLPGYPYNVPADWSLGGCGAGQVASARGLPNHHRLAGRALKLISWCRGDACHSRAHLLHAGVLSRAPCLECVMRVAIRLIFSGAVELLRKRRIACARERAAAVAGACLPPPASVGTQRRDGHTAPWLEGGAAAASQH